MIYDDKSSEIAFRDHFERIENLKGAACCEMLGLKTESEKEERYVMLFKKNIKPIH
jgi:hypothetical protein